MIFYWVLTPFWAAQLVHSGDFRGASQTVHAILNLSHILIVPTKIVFLVLYGIKTVWWASLVIAGIDYAVVGILASMFQPKSIYEMNMPCVILSLLGLIAVPTLGFFMFFTLYR